MKSDLILEIGTEELPPSCTGDGLNSLRTLLEKNFIENRIKFNNISAYSLLKKLSQALQRIFHMTRMENQIKLQ